ncbi:hypothetical protein L0F63_002988 [Massospora cicadina]|nr:hypothetical protein L0F63_002988 [Massospora cicadina]
MLVGVSRLVRGKPYPRRLFPALVDPTYLRPRSIPRDLQVGSQLNLPNYSTAADQTSMKLFLQFLGTGGAHDSPSAFILFSDQHRYLFNCGDSTQRLIYEHKARLNRFDAIFLSKVHCDNLGGLPGLLLTAADSGASKVCINGGPNLAHVLATMRHYVQRVGLDVEVNELIPSSPPFKDSILTVHAAHVLPVTDPGFSLNSETCPALEALDPELQTKRTSLKRCARLPPRTRQEIMAELATGAKTKRHKVPRPNHPLMRGRLPPAFPRAVAISYICHTADVLGKFDPVAAKALGLNPGPIYAELKRGNTVTTPEGVVIRPEQCVGPSKKGPIFMVLDCPGVQYIPGLVGHPKFQAYRAGQEHVVGTIVHNVGESVVLNADYLEFMKSFGPSTVHIVCGPDVCPATLNFLRSAQSLLALSSLDDEIFSTPYHASATQVDARHLSEAHGLNLVAAVPKMLCHISDGSRIELPPPNRTLPLSDPDSAPRRAVEQMSAFHEAVAKVIKVPPANTPGPFISTLGTGSAIPSLIRNVSANLVTLPGGDMILLDAGEGTLGQLYRHLGDGSHRHPKLNANLVDFYDRLSIIYISHPHADHHLGILQIMSELYRHSTVERPRYLIMPRSLYAWLCEYGQAQNIGLHLWEFIASQDLTDQFFFKYRYFDMKDVKDIRTCQVHHCQEAFGVRFEFKDGFKLVYSGDTRPCQSLVEIGMGADLLIHEATMDDELLDEAKAKRHSTISEALRQGKAMGAKQVLLTHFSQRYPGCAFSSSAKQQPIAVAFDFIDFERFQAFYKPLGRYIAADAAEDTDRALLAELQGA